MPEVLVAGAGPAGSVAALILARAGHRVTLVDACLPVRHRIESLPAHAMPMLHGLRLGSVIQAAELGRAIETELAWRGGNEHRQHTNPPILLHRPRLHASLRSAALACGVRLRPGRLGIQPDGTAILRGDTVAALTSDVILDARGRAAGGMHALGPARIALPFQARASRTLPDRMRLVAGPDAWIWLACHADGQVEGALFTAPESLMGTKPDTKRRMIAEIVQDLTEISLGRPCPATLACATPWSDGPVIRVADAALARDPIGAHGLTHAFRSAVQAAAATRTLLEAPDDAGAARAYLAHRHQLDCEAAWQATCRAYVDQARYATPFWDGPAPAPQPDLPRPEPTRRLTLNTHATRVPCLSGGLIRWTDGMTLPLSGKPAAHLGGVAAPILLDLLSTPGSASEMATRLSRVAPRAAVPALLDHLLAERVLAPITEPDDINRR